MRRAKATEACELNSIWSTRFVSTKMAASGARRASLHGMPGLAARRTHLPLRGAGMEAGCPAPAGRSHLVVPQLPRRPVTQPGAAFRPVPGAPAHRDGDQAISGPALEAGGPCCLLASKTPRPRGTRKTPPRRTQLLPLGEPVAVPPAPSPGVVRLGCLVHPGCAGHRLGQDATGTVNQGGSARSGGPATRAPHLPSTGNPLGRGRCCDAQLSLCVSVMCAALAKSSCQSSGGAATFAGQHVHSRVGGRQPRQRPEVPPRPAAPPWTSGGGHEEELSSPGTTISHHFRRDGARELDGALAPARGQVGHPPKQQ